MIREIMGFALGSLRVCLRGGKFYFAWMAVLTLLILQGLFAYAHQTEAGLILTHMRDQVSWGFYIGNFTFLVGVAAAAVMLVIPAYIYNWKPIKEIVVFGELLAVASIVMCLFFILVDMGRPDRFWHIMPVLGIINFPRSLLAWDSLVLNVYLALNATVAAHILFSGFLRRDYNHRIVTPLVLLSIPAAVSIHTVTAFLYNGMAARPYWNSAILAPRFLASAFCSGPAILLILMQILRKTTSFRISDEAIHKIAELMAYAMFINLFLLGAEVFKEFYSNTEHVVYIQYLFFGLHGHPSPIAFWGWLSVIFGIIAFILFLIPALRRNTITMNIGCVLIYISVYIEKGIALIIPGYTPSVLGEVYEYFPSVTELRISTAIFGIGFLLFTLMVKVGIAILFEDLSIDRVASAFPFLKLKRITARTDYSAGLGH